MTESRVSQKILVPLDGSELAELSLDVADRLLTGKSEGKLYLLRSLETPQFTAWLPADLLVVHEREKEIVSEYLDNQSDKLSQGDYEVTPVVGAGPGPVNDVISFCEEKEIDLIVITSHGASGWVKFFLGSNTEKILKMSRTKMLVLKAKENKIPEFKRILIPLDGSKRAESALPHALDIAPGGDAVITLVGVSVAFKGHAFEGDMKLHVEPDRKKIQEYLDNQAEWLSNQGYSVSTVVRRGEPHEEVLEQAAEEDADLILMTSQGRTGFDFWRYGSVAERIVSQSDCSVLILKEVQ